MDGAQITLLVIAGIIILFFIKYKITGSIKKEFQFIARMLDRNFDRIGVLAMSGAVMSAVCSGIIVYSLVAPPVSTIEVRVTSKESHYNGLRYGHSYRLYLIGDSEKTDVGVSRRLYDMVSIGDRLTVEESPFFRDWRRAQVSSSGRLLGTVSESEFVPAVIMALVFLLPLGTFPLYFRMRDKRLAGGIVLVIIILLELIPLGILFVGRG